MGWIRTGKYKYIP